MLLLVLLVFRLPEQPASLTPLDSLNMNTVWRWDRGGAYAVERGFGLTYCGSGSSVLVIRDSTVTSAVGLPGECEGLQLEGRCLYAAAGKAGLVSLDLTDPERPRVTGVLDLPGYALGLAVSGGLALVAAGDYGIHAVDVSDPARLELVSSAVPAESVLAIAIDRGYAYLACGREEALVLDARRPEGMSLAATIECPGAALGLGLKDTALYILCGPNGALVVNVARPESPIVTNWQAWGGAVAMRVDGSLAAVAAGWNGVALLDVSEPLAPQRYPLALPVAGYCVDVAVGAGRLSAAAGPAGLGHYDVSTPGNPLPRGRTPMPGYTYDVATQGSIAWVCMSGGLFTVDLDAPERPDLGACPLPAPPASFALRGGIGVVVLGDSGIGIIAAADSTHPQLLRTLPVPGYPITVALQDSWAFIGTNDSGVSVVSVARPEQPVRVASLNSVPHAVGLDVSGSLLVAASGDSGLYFMDISDPRQPRLAGRLLLPGRVNGVAINKGLVAACGNSGGFIIDAHDMAIPRLVRNLPLAAEGWDVVLNDTLCCIAADWVGVVCYNVRDSARSWVSGYYRGATLASAVALAGEDPVMGDLYSGLTRLKLSIPAAIREMPTREQGSLRVPAVQVPPVVWASVTALRSPATISLLDASGRAVAQAKVGSAGYGQLVTFDAYPLGAGVYFIRCESTGRATVTRTSLIR